jgi:SAM-dependent methyltransferase
MLNKSAMPRFPKLQAILPTARALQIRYALSSLPLRQARRILVVGAGRDPYKSLFRNATRYVTVDLEPVPGTTSIVADASGLPFPDASFDCVLSTEVLEYVPDENRFVEEMHRVLCPGGVAIVTVPFLFNFHDDLRRFTKLGLARLFERFPELSVSGQGNRLTTVWDLLTTSFWPLPVFAPLRIFSNLFTLMPSALAYKQSRSSAPTGFLVYARKA